MYRKIITPDKDNHSVEMPEEFFGKKVVITVVELNDEVNTTQQAEPPVGKQVSLVRLFEFFGADPNFPSADELRSKAWPSKW